MTLIYLSAFEPSLGGLGPDSLWSIRQVCADFSDYWRGTESESVSGAGRLGSDFDPRKSLIIESILRFHHHSSGGEKLRCDSNFDGWRRNPTPECLADLHEVGHGKCDWVSLGPRACLLKTAAEMQTQY
jgi:hypothetical protein